MKIISNLNGYDDKLILDLPKDGEVRKIISDTLRSEDASDKVLLLNILTVGRRVLNDRDNIDIVNLIEGRKHRKYWAVKHKNKITVKFAWYKIKRFNDKERKYVQENWCLDFFDTIGKRFVKQVNGVVYCDVLLAKYIELS